MKKIVVVSVRKPSNAGGAEIVWQNLSKKGFKFSDVSLEEKDLPLLYKKATNLFHIKEVLASRWLLKKGLSMHPDVIIYDKLFGWPKINTPIKKICYNHGSYTMAGLKFKQKNPVIYLFYKHILGFCEKRSYKNADKVIAVSKSVKKEMVDYFKVDDRKIKVINNGVDLKTFRPMKNKKKLKKRYHIPENKKILFFPGRPSYGKGFDIAAEVLEKLGNDYFLVVLGEGTSKRNVKFLGKVANSKMPEIYNAADLCFFPSRYEGNSVSVLESAACGTPLILSGAGLMKTEEEMNEFVGHSTESYINKIKKIFERNNLEEAAAKWKKFAERFSLERQLKEMRQFIENE